MEVAFIPPVPSSNPISANVSIYETTPAMPPVPSRHVLLEAMARPVIWGPQVLEMSDSADTSSDC